MHSEHVQSSASTSLVNDALLRSIKRDKIPPPEFSNLPYLNYLRDGSQRDNMSEAPINANIEMWNTKMLKALKSELISLCVCTEQLDKVFNEKVNAIESNIFDELRQCESKQSLCFNDLCFRTDKFESFHAEQRYYENIYRKKTLESAEKKKSDKKDIQKGEVKERTKEEKQQYIQQNQDNIWLNTDKFLKPIEDFSKIHKILSPSQKINIDSDNISIGQHYSLKLYKNIKNDANDIHSRLIVPPPSDKIRSSNSNILHKRLISALIPIERNGDTHEETPVKGNPLDQNDPSLANRITPNSIGVYGTPTPQGQGLSHYVNMCVGNRIELELESLQMKSASHELVAAHTPIAKELSFLYNSQEKVIANVNRMKSLVSDSIQRRMSVFQERVTLRKEWSASLENYLKYKEQKQSKSKAKK